MHKIFIFFVVFLCACSSTKQYDNHENMTKNIDQIKYFLNRLECHEMFDKCVTKNYEMYISKNNSTLVIENTNNKLIVFFGSRTNPTVYQLESYDKLLFYKGNVETKQDQLDNKYIADVIYEMVESL